MSPQFVRPLFGVVILALYLSNLCAGFSTRCFVCSSRGPLGDCGEPFWHNTTSFKSLPGGPIDLAGCPSGWCRKQVGISGSKNDNDHGTYTRRQCLQIPPPDHKERCAKVTIDNMPTLLCFCRGDLCNTASPPQFASPVISVASVLIVTLVNNYFTVF